MDAIQLIDAEIEKLSNIEETLKKLRAQRKILVDATKTTEKHEAKETVAVRRKLGVTPIAATKSARKPRGEGVTAKVLGALSKGGVNAKTIAALIHADVRQVSFALQALKRQGKVVMESGLWSLVTKEAEPEVHGFGAPLTNGAYSVAPA